MRPEEHHVVDFRARTRVEPTAVMLRDYDFRRPMLDLVGRAPAAFADGAPAADPTMRVPASGQALEVYDHHAEYEESDAVATHAGVYLQQLRAGVREADARSLCRRLLPGHRFDLSDHDVDKLNASWVVARLDHRGSTVSPPARASGSTRTERSAYPPRCRCAPRAHRACCAR
jgi:type VI secretion system secreted protein VgrG